MAERFMGVEALKDFIRKDYCTICDCNIEYPECLPLCGLEGLFELIDEAPTIEAKPVVHAHWEVKEYQAPFDEDLHYQMICSNCGNDYCSDEIFFTNYCHKCGAQMDEVIE